MSKPPTPKAIVADLRRLKDGKEQRFPRVTLLGDDQSRGRVQHFLATGLTVLDRYVLGGGGLPYGRVVEIFGPEAAGKDTVMDCILAGAQRDGSIAALADSERKWNRDWAIKFGVDVDSVVYEEPEYLEMALRFVEEMVKRSTPERRVVVALNSVAACPPRSEFEDGASGDAALGEVARLWSKFMRGIVGPVADNQALVLLVNQIRMKIGVMYGNPEVTPGGQAIKFYSQVRLSVGHGKFLDGKRQRVVRVTAFKNGLAPPMRTCQLLLDFEKGFNDGWSVLNHAKEEKVVPAGCRSVKAALEALKWPVDEDASAPADLEYDPETGEVADAPQES